MNPMFSIIIPSFNRADIICEALESVRLEQERTGFVLEVLVADDYSRDETQVVISAWCKKKSINWVHYECLTKKSGVCAARNNGVDRSSGELLVFLDSDDQILPGSLEHIKHIFEQQSDVAIVYGAIRMKSGRMGFLPKKAAQECPLDFQQFLSLKGEGEYLQICRRSLVEDSTMRFCAELNGFESILWMRALQQGAKLWIDPLPVRLYDDLRSDRLSHPKNLAKNSERLAAGFRMFFKEFGASIEKHEPSYWAALLLRVVFYSKVSNVWDSELKVELGSEISNAPLKIKIIAVIPSVYFRLIYPVLNRFRGLFAP